MKKATKAEAEVEGSGDPGPRAITKKKMGKANTKKSAPKTMAASIAKAHFSGDEGPRGK